MLDQRLIEFQKQSGELEKKRALMADKVKAALKQAGVSYQTLTSRVKSEESLRKKLGRPDKTYGALWDVTDLIGVRIVTYFEDNVEEIASLVERSFSIDYQKSTNKMNWAEHDRFGYRSLHYICFVEGDPNLRFEIQIRTILQHAWAEIEHDLGYKAGDLAPQKIRRRFSRIAGLLEIADEEFVSIREELDAYVESVKANAETVELDTISVASLLEQNDVHSLDREIAGSLGVALSVQSFFPAYLVKMLQATGLRSVKETLEALRKHHAQIQANTKPYFDVIGELWGIRFEGSTEMPRGYSLILLSHLLIIASEPLALNKVRKLSDMYRAIDRDSQIPAMDIANRFVERLS